MWYPAVITAGPAQEPVKIEEAFAHLRLSDDGEWGLVQQLIAVSRTFVEDYCAVRFATQTAVMKCDAFADLARLPEAPVQSVTSIGYVDAAGATQTLSSDVYELRADRLDAAIVAKYGKVWPVVQPRSRITVTAIVGTAVIPPPVKQAMLLHLGFLYERREGGSVTDLDAMNSLLANYRRGA